MSDVGDNNFITYIYRGADGEIIPDYVTRIIVHRSIRVILRRAFWENENIVEVICHENVKKIEEYAFYQCFNLRRVIMPGVKEVEIGAFSFCERLSDVECGKLEIIKAHAFNFCYSLSSINLPSARIVEECAFSWCSGFSNVKLGSKLERIDARAFLNCYSLEQITIPLKDGIINEDDAFIGCEKLMYVDLVEGGLLKTIPALQLEDWRNDMCRELVSIITILPDARSGHYMRVHDDDGDYDDYDNGEKARAIRIWIRSVLRKIILYQAEHRRVLDEDVTPTLKLVLPQEIVIHNALPFLDIPPHKFEVEED